MIKGLYAITPDDTNTERLLAKVALALQGGVSLLQYRNK
nr:thiamine phosphate synthase [Methylotenera sp.]